MAMRSAHAPTGSSTLLWGASTITNGWTTSLTAASLRSQWSACVQVEPPCEDLTAAACQGPARAPTVRTCPEHYVCPNQQQQQQQTPFCAADETSHASTAHTASTPQQSAIFPLQHNICTLGSLTAACRALLRQDSIPCSGALLLGNYRHSTSSTSSSSSSTSSSTSSAFGSHWGGRRSMGTTITKSGVPKPRPEVEQALSTHQGGHLTKRINFSTSLSQLAKVVEGSRDKLQPLHLALAAKKLEALVVKEKRTSSSSLQVQLMARAIEQAACKQATWLNAWHIATIVRALTDLSIRMRPDSLMLLAAVLTAEDCKRLHMEDGPLWRDAAYGFAMQNFQNSLFWEKLCAAAAGPISGWHGMLAASFLKNTTLMAQPSEAFVRAAADCLSSKVGDLNTRDVADTLYAAVKLINFGQPPATHRPSQATSSASTLQDSSSSSGGGGDGAKDGASGSADNRSSKSASMSRQAGEGAAAGVPPSGYSAELQAMLRQQLVHELKAAGLQRCAALDWEGKSLALFASSLVHLGTADQQALACVVEAAVNGGAARGLQPLYVLKLTKACAAMGCEDLRFFKLMVSQARTNLQFTAHGLRSKLLQAFQAVPVLAKQDVLLALERSINQLNGPKQQQQQQQQQAGATVVAMASANVGAALPTDAVHR